MSTAMSKHYMYIKGQQCTMNIDGGGKGRNETHLKHADNDSNLPRLKSQPSILDARTREQREQDLMRLVQKSY